MSGYNTQGEWEAVGPLVRTKRAQDGSGGWLVAECPHVGTDDAKDNAARIAALPELIEALDCLIAVVGLTAFKYEGQRAVLQDAVNLGYAALAKARGDAS